MLALELLPTEAVLSKMAAGGAAVAAMVSEGPVLLSKTAARGTAVVVIFNVSFVEDTTGETWRNPPRLTEDEEDAAAVAEASWL